MLVVACCKKSLQRLATVFWAWQASKGAISATSRVSSESQSRLVSTECIFWVYPVGNIFISNLARSTAAEVNFRIDTVYGLLTEGQSRGQIVQFCANQWNIDNRQADNYIKRARIRLEQDADMARPAWLAEALGRLRTYEQSAYKRGQTQVAVNAVQLQAKLIGFDL